jgi:hypothetical protein
MSDASDGPRLVDAPAVCPGGGVFVSGDLVDWDSTSASFLGVFDAKLSLPGSSMPLLSTPPNGRIETCVPAVFPLRFDLDAPADYLDGTLVIQREALTSLRPLNLRSITLARAGSFFTGRGLTFDPNRAQVVVFLAGDLAQVALDRAHDAVQAGNDGAQPGTVVWTAGDTGRYVLFPNVDTAQPTAMLTGLAVPLSVPLAPGKLTLVAISFVFI